MRAWMTLCCLIGLASACLGAFDDETARRVLAEAAPTFSVAETLPSVAFHEAQGIVFVALRWQPKAEADNEDCNELLQAADALERYLAQGLEPWTPPPSPFCPTLTAWLEPVIPFACANIGQCILRDEVANGVRTQLLAWDGEAVRAERERFQALRARLYPSTPEAWLEALRKTAERFQTPETRDKFLTLLGCPIVNVIERAEVGAPLPAGEAGQREVRELLAYIQGADSFFAAHPQLCAFRAEPTLFFPPWTSDDGGRLAQAKQLFAQGRELERILQLLLESIALNPISAEKWGYLGGALRVSGRPRDAVFAYLQALRYDATLGWAWEGLRVSCAKAEMPANAAALAWYLRLIQLH